ncbi:MAG: NADH-quinone oxidoreductase subunit H [Deltaproteobacteria bacterium]|nr:NADH-quinone oxidoreductase subunit H [Deltaproteobacteria bacterium]
MTTTFLVTSSLVKVLVILLITVGGFAPIIIWAERRQSAMIQDRLGPSRAAIVLPASAVTFIDRARLPMWRLAALTGIVAIVALVTLTFVAIKGSNPLPISTSSLTASMIAFGVASVVLRAGYAVHSMIVRNGGKIMLIGLLLADALKFIFKEDFVPPKGDKLLFSAGPIIALIPAIAAFAVIPFASSLHWDYLDQVLPRTGEIAGLVVPLQVASLNVGILFIFAIASTGIIGAAISGYASDNKFSLLGGIRAASQMADGQLRGRSRPDARSGVHGLCLASARRHDHVAARPRVGDLRSAADPGGSHFLGCGHRRNEARPFRPPRGGKRARRRLSHGIFRHEVRDVLHG